MASLLFEIIIGIGVWTTGSTARISSGSSSGSGAFPEDFAIAWGIWRPALMVCGTSPRDLGFSIDV